MDLSRRDALRLAALLGALVPLAACDHDPPSVPPRMAPVRLELARSVVGRSPGDPEAAPAAAASVHALAAGLFDAVVAGPGNIALSPYSVAVALAMTANGARGRTAAEMLDVLGSGRGSGGIEGLDEGLAALTQHVEGLAGPVDDGSEHPPEIELTAANELFAQVGNDWEEAFLDALARWFGAGVRLVDYGRDPEAARGLVNGWTAEQTHERIPEILPAGAVDRLTRLVLVDALYLKAPWAEPFNEARSGDRAFELDDGTVTAVPTMSGALTSAALGAGDGWQAIRLLYAGGGLAMTIVLPDRGRKGEVTELVLRGGLPRILASVEQQPLELGLPRWTFRSTTPLTDVLAGMGMPSAFDPRRADFSGMTRDERLHVDAVLHETFVAVDEHGTEAAAATAIVMGATSAQVPVEEVYVNRPFLFVVHDVQHGTPLFLGRVDDPRA
ncbi:serpin family protein [Nocardioides sp. MAHUQ-72]|uniref:serpin family protein n=1 Tax=unclassified Nocardioides TaxID=2615069 RepID=UPI00361FAB8D